MFRSLWFKLFIAFTIVTILGISVLGMLRSAFLNYREFKRVVVPETISEIVRSQQLPFTEAMKNPKSGKWLAMVKKELSADILNMTGENSDFNIGFASSPKMYYEVRDNSGDIFTNHPDVFPDQIRVLFNKRREAAGPDSDMAERLGRDGLIWVSQSMRDEYGVVQGRMHLLLDAEFKTLDVLRRLLAAQSDGWPIMMVIFATVGLLCGIGANWFVTGRLKDMNAAAAVWSAGDFTPRIPVDDKSHDILAEHSRILNGMANEMESLVALRQKAAVAEERNRVARELHDTVKQNLFALKLQLAAIQRKNTTAETSEHIEEAQQITREAQQDIIRILTQLASAAPDVPDGKGVYRRLADFSEDMRRRYGLKTIWEGKGDFHLGPGGEQALLRIVQEAMNNAVQHGEATEVTMTAFTDGTRQGLRMSDNGRGFRKDKAAKRTSGRSSGMGLVFMRERAGELPDGEFDISPNERGGATVQITWRAE